jgi:hypothetical protein
LSPSFFFVLSQAASARSAAGTIIQDCFMRQS